ncbi:MAG TPA: hypothetical protein VF653_19170 [Methylomirabilota bacterium]
MRTALLAVLMLLVSAPAVSAQSKSGSIELEYKPRTPPVRPVPPKKIEEDTAQAIQEIDRRRADQAMRKQQPAPLRKPNLDPDVTGGIQTRGLSDTLRR